MEGTFLDAALHYASMGYRVFPLAPGAKVPIAGTCGRDDATTDAAVIETWWTNNPMCNVGIATDGLLVVDVDGGKQNPWLRTVDMGELMAGPVAKTRSAGFHYWFKQVGEQSFTISASKIAPKVDTRGNGGYVVAPPSIVGGKKYEWVYELDCSRDLLPLIPAFVVEGLGEKLSLAESVSDTIPHGQRNAALIRFAGAFRRTGMSEAEIFETLQVVNVSRCKPPLKSREVQNIAKSAARYEPDIVEVSLIYSHLTGMVDNPEREDEGEEEKTPAFPVECLDKLPKYFKLAHDYALATAIKPQPELTLGSLASLFGALFGRKVRDIYNTRTNLMVLGLAPSGAGKEHPRQVNKEILFRANADKLNGPERIASHAGVISSLVDHPARLFQIDEIGRLLQTMRDSSKNPHLFNVGTVLMQLFSSANTIWHGDAYADIAKVKKIDQPCCCLFGTSVPEGFYAGLTPESLSDGLLARMIVIASPGYGVRQTPEDRELPTDLLRFVSHWFEYKPPAAGNLGTSHPRPLLIQKSTDAHERQEAYGDAVHSKHGTEDDVKASVWARAPEKAAKLALIYACADCEPGGIPFITHDAVEWAIAIVNYSTRLVLSGAANNVATSSYEAQKKRFWRCLKHGMTVNQMTRKTQWLRSRERSEIVADLEACGAMAFIEEATATKPKKVVQLLRKTL